MRRGRSRSILWVSGAVLCVAVTSLAAAQPPEDAEQQTPPDVGAETAPPPPEETAPPPPEETAPLPPDEEAPEEDDGLGLTIFDTHIYGYIDAFWEKDAPIPVGVDPMTGETLTEEVPHEFDIANFHLMVQGHILERFRYFVNFASPGAGSNADDEPIGLRNGWVEVATVRDLLNIRAGKTYRRFGLYNEILDAVPTFIGIEPPEIFDKDHLMLTRTTNFMLHGTAPFGDNSLHYSVATGNDEREGDQVPIGADIHFDLGTLLRVGTSFYWSGGTAIPTRAVGEGSPRGGVANWMASDEFVVFGGYAQLTVDALTLQAEYWQAEHSAVRDPASVMLLDGSLNPSQQLRFFVNGDPLMGVNTAADYTVRTFYVRAGYEIPIASTQLVPYLQLDYYENPEIVADKDLGGDNEAGLSDDGIFWKPTVGLVFRPIPYVALKIDGSLHVQQFNNSTFVYPEVRVSLSFQWQLEFPQF